MRSVVLIAATVTAGVTAVVYLNFSARVMPALSRLPATTAMARMQSFNRTAVRPPFMLCFFGAALTGGFLLVQQLRRGGPGGEVLAAAGGVLYIAGFLLTIAYHVPLNERLARVAPQDPGSVPLWQHYVSSWTRANTVRGALSGAATLLLLAATVTHLGDR